MEELLERFYKILEIQISGNYELASELFKGFTMMETIRLMLLFVDKSKVKEIYNNSSSNDTFKTWLNVAYCLKLAKLIELEI